MLNFDHALGWAAAICLSGAFLGCLHTALAALLTLRFGRSDGINLPAEDAPAVTVLVPLCGEEAGLEARLRTLCAQHYPAPVQVLCGVADEADPAIGVVKRLAAKLPEGALDLHVDGRLHGRNLKISNLMNMLARARHDTLVLIDSDIKVGSDYLARVIGELRKPGVGAVTCFYYGIARGGLWAMLAAMGINLQFVPGAIMGMRFGLARPCFGATVAIRRATLDEIGGLGRFADQLWDDYAVGEAVREAGHRVAVAALAVGHVCADKSAREMFGREQRVARTIGSIDPAGHTGAVIAYPFPLALLALLLGGGSAALTLAAVALALRYGLMSAVMRRFPASANTWWLLPVRDIAAFAVYAMSFFGGTVVWRGRRYRVRSDGTLLQQRS